MFRVSSTLVLLFVALLAACTSSPPGALPGPHANSNSQVRQAGTASQRDLGEGLIAPVSEPGGQPTATGSRTAFELLIADQTAGHLTDVTDRTPVLQLVVPLSNGGRVSIRAHTGPSVTALRVDTGSEVVPLERITATDWQGDFQYLNLNNDPVVPAYLTIILSTGHKITQTTFPVKVLHDS